MQRPQAWAMGKCPRMRDALEGGGGGAEIRIVSGCLPERIKSKVLTSFHKATGMLSTVPSLVSAPNTLLLFHSFPRSCRGHFCLRAFAHTSLLALSSRYLRLPLADVLEACAPVSLHRKAFLFHIILICSLQPVLPRPLWPQ